MVRVGFRLHVLFTAALSATTLSPANWRAVASAKMGETLVFEDQFDDFDLSIWKHDITLAGGGNWEFQLYTNNRSNSFVEDGVLHLMPTLTAGRIGESSVSGEEPYTLSLWGLTPPDQCTSNAYYGCERSSDSGSRHALNPIQSARISTSGTFHVTYGRVEVEAKIPKGDWIWPAIWLMPEHNAYGGWPASGEIDIMESRGNSRVECSNDGDGASNACPAGNSEVSSTLHWGPFYSLNNYWRTTGSMELESHKSFADDYHTYGLSWDESGLYTYVDQDENRILSVEFDQTFWGRGEFDNLDGVDNPWNGRSNSAPFDRSFYIILNVAVGGASDYFSDLYPNKPWDNDDSDAPLKFWEAKDQWYPTWNGRDAALKVKSVKVWEKAGGEHYLKGECDCDGSRSGEGSDQGTNSGRVGQEYQMTFRFTALVTLMNTMVLVAMGVCWGLSSLRHPFPGYGREAGDNRKGLGRRQGGYQIAPANLHVATGTEFGMPSRSSSRKPFANAMHL